MGKRKRYSDDYDNIAKRIKNLERELLRVRRGDQQDSRRISSSSSDSDSSSSSSHRYPITVPSLPEPPYIEGVPTTSMGAETAETELPEVNAAPVIPQSITLTVTDPIPSTSATLDQILPGSDDHPQALDDELLHILGNDPSQVKKYNKDIQPELAVRLQHIATSGLSKEDRKELLEKYLLPANCKLIGAPTLNPETENAVPDLVKKRDKGIELRQKQRAAAISCVAEALTVLMSSDPKNTAVIQLLWDANKLLCDNQASDSSTRKSFVLNSLRKDLKDRLLATNIDTMLFGEKLPETLKAAQAISKSVADMKPTPAKPPAATKYKPASHHLNWRAPAPMPRPRGTNRSKEPVPQNSRKNHHASSSRKSSHPAQNFKRNQR